jgi:hypothetical protein
MGWLRLKKFQNCKAYMADQVAQNDDLLKDMYLVWRTDRDAYNAERIQEYINCWDLALGVEAEQTEILTTEFRYAILVKPGSPWLYGPPGLHLHTFLIRTAMDWDGTSDPLQHVYKTTTGLMSGYSDASYAVKAKETLTTCIEHRMLPFQKYTWSRYRSGGNRCGYSHSDGFVDLHGDPLEKD